MKRILTSILILFCAGILSGARSTAVDICVYGESASGCIAAIEGARHGKSVVLVSKNRHVGGLVTSGLTATDMNRQAVIGGITAEFYQRIYKYYENPAVWRNQGREEFFESSKKRTFTGKNDPRRMQWVYESGVAEKIMRDMLDEAGVQIHFDAQVSKVSKKGGRIRNITLTDGSKISAKVFIDCSYTGDLMARSGVGYTVGREGVSQYGESFAGIRVHDVDLFGNTSGINPRTGRPWPLVDAQLWGKPGDGDSRVQSYCYRVTLTDDPSNQVAISKPEGYNPDYYEVLLGQIRNKPGIQLKEIITFTPMPNRKTDTNHLDFFGAAHAYPEASYEERLEIEKQHRTYAQGMLWFLGHDERVPQYLREEMARWGYAKDEFGDTGNFPNHLYVRESRRMTGDYVMTQNNMDKVGRTEAPMSVGRGSYPLDCHFVSTVIVDGKLYREGTMYTAIPTYPISYRSLTPKKEECENLLVTVCLSASHVAYSSIRMEPQYMVLGQSAAAAAVLSIDGGCAVQGIDYERLAETLKNEGQIL